MSEAERAMLRRLAVFAVAGFARRQVGGYTGDILGAIEQIGEIAMLLTVSAR